MSGCKDVWVYLETENSRLRNVGPELLGEARKLSQKLGEKLVGIIMDPKAKELAQQAIDGDTAQVGPMIAEHLGLAQISCVSKIEIEGDSLIATQERENSYAKLKTKLPALVSVTKSINEPRLPNIMKKLKANRIEPEIINAESLSDLDESKIGLKGSPTKVSKIFVPNREKHTVYIEGKNPADSAVKLIEALEEAKIQFIGGAGV